MASFVKTALLNESGINYRLSVGTNKYDATANLFPKKNIVIIIIFCRGDVWSLHFPNTEIDKI